MVQKHSEIVQDKGKARGKDAGAKDAGAKDAGGKEAAGKGASGKEAAGKGGGGKEAAGKGGGRETGGKGGGEKTVSPVSIAKALGGIDFPRSKEDLIQYARQNKGAVKDPESVVRVIEQLPEREYRNMADVEREVGKSA